MAAPFQNYSGGTFLTDLVTRPEFLQYVQEEVYNRCQWIQSGVVQRNSALDCSAGGTRVRVPFFQPMPETEEVITSAANWGDSGQGYLTPKGITASEQVMTILHRGGAYAADDLSRLGSGADPMAAIRSYLADCILKLRTTTLLSQLEGLFGSALDENVLDASINTSGAAEANFLSASNVVKAQAQLGERGDDLTTIAMHSNVAYYLRTVGALTFSTSALSTGGEITWGGGGIGLQSTEVAYFMGLRVIVDDMLKPTVNDGGADQYPVYLMGGGSVAEGVQRAFFTEHSGRRSQHLKQTRRPVLDARRRRPKAFHVVNSPLGTSWKNANDNPTNALLSTAGNWECVYGADDTGNEGDGQKLVPERREADCQQPTCRQRLT